MSEREALYAAVLAAPDDDTPRLVFADFLDDTGARADAIRARFIRNQIALARAEPGTDEWHRLYRATASAEDYYRSRWAAGVEAGYRVWFARGFVETVMVGAEQFLSTAGRLFERHPVRSAMLTGESGGSQATLPTALATSPLLARLHTLRLSSVPPGDDFLAVLRTSPHVQELRHLTLGWWPEGDVRLGDAGLLFLPSLVELGLRNISAVGDRLIRDIAVHPGLAQLHTLNLSNVQVGGDSIAALAASPHASGLKRLRFVGGRDRTATCHAAVLARSPHLRGLTDLDLGWRWLSRQGAEELAATYAWPGLRRLGLRGNDIPASAVPAFAANPLLRSLVEIDLRSNPIQSSDLGPLREACPHTRLLTDDTERPMPVELAPEDRP